MAMGLLGGFQDKEFGALDPSSVSMSCDRISIDNHEAAIATFTRVSKGSSGFDALVAWARNRFDSHRTRLFNDGWMEDKNSAYSGFVLRQRSPVATQEVGHLAKSHVSLDCTCTCVNCQRLCDARIRMSWVRILENLFGLPKAVHVLCLSLFVSLFVPSFVPLCMSFFSLFFLYLFFSLATYR